ncbi:MAG: class I tRNA ligase family protein [Saprospiraceae bacterium]|nr:class I tRNA ligase family protein [Saprospiraceae bacterium]
MNFDFSLFEAYCKDYWKENKTYQVDLKSTRPKYYILDMFPYPSGSGLHVGHPLGYIASDIVARWKRMCGFHVLHPMGFDAFGLPAEQYAIQTGVHPKDSTETNINRYIDQLDNIGFNYDWSRSVNTSDPKYYKWTQWIFLKLFDHYYDTESNSAKSINLLKLHFEQFGTSNLQAAHSFEGQFTPEEWKRKSLYEKEDILMNFRLAYRKVSYVNWCEALSTVLANDEIKDGVSERGGHPVEKKPMMQWALRITAYADRLLSDLDSLQWSDALKTMQRNWIGKSSGAQIYFSTEEGQSEIEIYTTRPDTIYGVSFLVLAPEHSMIKSITRKENLDEVNQYIEQVSSRSEVERQTEGKNVSGVFSGTYAIHPFTGEKFQFGLLNMF